MCGYTFLITGNPAHVKACCAFSHFRHPEECLRGTKLPQSVIAFDEMTAHSMGGETRSVSGNDDAFIFRFQRIV